MLTLYFHVNNITLQDTNHRLPLFEFKLISMSAFEAIPYIAIYET